MSRMLQWTANHAQGLNMKEIGIKPLNIFFSRFFRFDLFSQIFSLSDFSQMIYAPNRIADEFYHIDF